MTSLLDDLRTLPVEETTRPGERLLRWGDELAVILLDSGEIGQFATSCRWSRAEVEDAISQVAPSSPSLTM